MTLAELQDEFGRYLLDGDERFAEAVMSTPELDSLSRIRIYSNAYRARLLEALSADFPVLRIVLGDGPFEELSATYATVSPSKSFTLRDFGGRLPSFIESQTAIPECAFAAELAAFEWALVEAFDATDHAAVCVDDVAVVPPESWPLLELTAHPSVRSVLTRFNTPSIWNAVKAGRLIPDVVEQTDSALCVVWRQGLSCVFRSMDPLEHCAWRAITGQANFAAMCDALLERLPAQEIAPRAAGLLRGWLVEGLIGTLRIP